MRLLARLFVVGILIASCSEGVIDPFAPGGACSAQDTVFFLSPHAMPLAMGGASEAVLEAVVLRCDVVSPIPAGNVTWSVRDPSVAHDLPEEFGSENLHVRLIVPRAAGSTFLVVEAPGWSDSLEVIVADTVAMGPVASVASGSDNSCAALEDGAVYCWGVGGGVLGHFGVDPAVGLCRGIECSPMPVERAAGAASVHVGSGGMHACTLSDAGQAWCWGDNGTWQLGGPSDGWNPVLAGGGMTFSDLTLGALHTCGLTSDGEALCWGDHTGGKLGGDQRTGPTATPVRVSDGLTFASLEALLYTTCGATREGHLYCWGTFDDSAPPPPGAETCTVGQSKDGAPVTRPCSYVPLRMRLEAPLDADSLFVQVAGRCALTDQGSVYCLSNTTGAFAPQSGSGPFSEITAGQAHHCGLTEAGAAWCWGDNGSGQLGDGSTAPRDVPAAVSGGHTFLDLSAQGSHTCGVTTDAEAWCWGSNWVGETGTSILDEWHTTPVKVRGQG